MNYLKNAIFLLLCVALGTGLGKLYLYFKYHPGANFSHSEPTLVTGTGDAPGLRGFSVQHLPGDYAALAQQWRNLWATTVGIHYDSSLTRDVLSSTVKAAHARQLAVVLLPPAQFSRENPYPEALANIAADAQAAHVDRLCISWLNIAPDASYWRKQGETVRQVFKGKTILAATPAALPEVTCWDAGDYVGVIGPIELPRRLPHASDSLTMADFRVLWACKLTEFESIGRLHELPVALLDIDVPQAVSTRLPIAGQPEPALSPTPDLQAECYRALLTETKGRAKFTDILLLTWDRPQSIAKVHDALGAVAEAWDPKKPLPQEPVALEPADDLGVPDVALDAANPADSGPALR